MSAIILIIKILVIIILSIIVLLLLVLFIPFKYEITAKITEKICFQISVVWMFGLIGVRVLKFEDKLEIKIYLSKMCVFTKYIGNNSKGDTDEKVNGKGKNIKLNKFLDLQTLKTMPTYIKKIINIVKPKSVKINGVYGFNDPYITGIIAAIGSIVTNSGLFHNIDLRPIFEDEILDIKVEISGEILNFKILFRTVYYIIKSRFRKLAILK